jgi:alkanesulfonate monooxygenase SsuD/methylene tetrahydromethanopterin reductase-like flavin-dependent oxidoreductase (luciferase family)
MRRGAATFEIGRRGYIAVNNDAQRARRRIGETLQRFHPFFQSSHLEAFPVSGSPDACVRGLREVAEAGAELILLDPVCDEAETRSSVRIQPRNQ